jgi:hypothetical protein
LTALLVLDLVADMASLAHFKRRSRGREAGEENDEEG